MRAISEPNFSLTIEQGSTVVIPRVDDYVRSISNVLLWLLILSVY